VGALFSSDMSLVQEMILWDEETPRGDDDPAPVAGEVEAQHDGAKVSANS
jgi:hypothetical protein